MHFCSDVACKQFVYSIIIIHFILFIFILFSVFVVALIIIGSIRSSRSSRSIIPPGQYTTLPVYCIKLYVLLYCAKPGAKLYFLLYCAKLYNVTSISIVIVALLFSYSPILYYHYSNCKLLLFFLLCSGAIITSPLNVCVVTSVAFRWRFPPIFNCL